MELAFIVDKSQRKGQSIATRFYEGNVLKHMRIRLEALEWEIKRMEKRRGQTGVNRYSHASMGGKYGVR